MLRLAKEIVRSALASSSNLISLLKTFKCMLTKFMIFKVNMKNYFLKYTKTILTKYNDSFQRMNIQNNGVPVTQ